MKDISNEPPKKGNLKIFGLVLVMIGIAIILYIMFINQGSDTRDDNVSLAKVQETSTENPVVLYFWSSNCGYCEEQKPIIEDLESEFSMSNVTFYWLDSSRHDDITDKYNIHGVPTTVVLNKDGVVKKFVGYTDLDNIENAIENSIDSYS